MLLSRTKYDKVVLRKQNIYYYIDVKRGEMVLKNVLCTVYKRIRRWFHPTLQDQAEMAGISEDLRCSEEGLRAMEKVIEEMRRKK